ncbi:MAG: alpha/beta fold hydrolase BchO [Myxococcota bacterium]
MGVGPPLWLLHGTGASSQSFRALMPRLSPHFTVVAPDLPGQGLSRAPSSFVPSPERMADALDELRLEFGPPEVVVGHSAGVAVLVELVRRGALAPRRLFGLAAALQPFSGPAGWLLPKAARWLSRSTLLPHVLAHRLSQPRRVDELLRGTGSSIGREHVDVYRALLSRPPHVVAVLSMMAHWNITRVCAALPHLSVPVTLVAGAQDLAVPVAQLHALKRRMPCSELHVIEGAGHLVHEERPRAVAKVILGSSRLEVTSCPTTTA